MPKEIFGLDPLFQSSQVKLPTDLLLTPELETGRFRLFPMVLYIAPWVPIHLRLWTPQDFSGAIDGDFPNYAFNPLSGLELLSFGFDQTQFKSRKNLQSQIGSLNVQGAFGADLGSYGNECTIQVGSDNTLATMLIPPAGWDSNRWLGKGPYYFNPFLNSILTDATLDGIDFEGKFHQQHSHYDDFVNWTDPHTSYKIKPIGTIDSLYDLGPSGFMECLDVLWHHYNWTLRFRAQDEAGKLVSEPVKILSAEVSGLTIHYPQRYADNTLALGDLKIASQYVNWNVSFLDHELTFSMVGADSVGFLEYHDEDLVIMTLDTGINAIYYEFFIKVKALVGGVEAIGWVVFQLNEMAINPVF